MNKFFGLNDTLYQIVEKYPETLEFFIANGFEQLKNKQMFESMAKNIKLNMALKIKNEKTHLRLFVNSLTDIVV